MRKTLKVFLSLMLVVIVMVSSSSVFASTEKSSGAAKSQTISTVRNDIANIESKLEQKNTDVISELNKQVQEYTVLLKSAPSPEEYDKIERLITTTNELIGDYSNYKQVNSNRTISSAATINGVYNPTYSAAVATVIAYFQANGYSLSAELLTHARDNNYANTIYYPSYGYICAQTPTYLAIWNSGGMSGSGSFNKNAFSSVSANDCYYGIHLFSWYKHIELSGNNYLFISDLYDYVSSNDYSGVAGVAVSTMAAAQNAGVIVPFWVYIKLYH